MSKKIGQKYQLQSIDDGLMLHGISPVDLDYHKIYGLKVNFDSYEGEDTTRSIQRGRKSGFDIWTVENIKNIPI